MSGKSEWKLQCLWTDSAILCYNASTDRFRVRRGVSHLWTCLGTVHDGVTSVNSVFVLHHS